MNDNQKILDSIKAKIQFEPIDDRVLVKPLKQKMIKKTFKVPAEKPEDLNAAEQTEQKMVDEVREVPINCSLGVILKIGRSTNSDGSFVKLPFKEGDTVVFQTNAGMPFELFKNSRLLKRYEILGLWV